MNMNVEQFRKFLVGMVIFSALALESTIVFTFTGLFRADVMLALAVTFVFVLLLSAFILIQHEAFVVRLHQRRLMLRRLRKLAAQNRQTLAEARKGEIEQAMLDSRLGLIFG